MASSGFRTGTSGQRHLQGVFEENGLRWELGGKVGFGVLTAFLCLLILRATQTIPNHATLANDHPIHSSSPITTPSALSTQPPSAQQATVSQLKPDKSQHDGDPTVTFETLDFDHIDYNTGPQGQKVYEVDQHEHMTNSRLYRGKDGKLYKHGTQVLRLPSGEVIQITNYAYGRLHGEWIDQHPNGGIRAKAEYYNGDKRHQELWNQNGTQLRDFYMLDGQIHGWSIWYDLRGDIREKTLYEHGKEVKTQRFDAESVIPK